jgi:hypothetical protein
MGQREYRWQLGGTPRRGVEGSFDVTWQMGRHLTRRTAGGIDR